MEQTSTHPAETRIQNSFLEILSAVGAYTHLSLVVDVVEVLSDAWVGALALDVRSGGSGGGVAGGHAAQSGQTSAAASRSAEERHDRAGPHAG